MEVLCGSSTSVLKLVYFNENEENDPLSSEKKILKVWRPAHELNSDPTNNNLGELKCLFNIGEGLLISTHENKNNKGCTTLLHSIEYDNTVKDKSKIFTDYNCRILPSLSSDTNQVLSIEKINDDLILFGWSNGDLEIVDINKLEEILNGQSSEGCTDKWVHGRIFTHSKPYLRFGESTNKALLCGGSEILATVVDISQKKEVWRAKNVPHDTLNMRVPVFDKDGDWMDSSTIVTSTAFGQIRLYDIRGPRRPIFDISLTDEIARNNGITKIQQITRRDNDISLNCVRCNVHSQDNIIVSSNRGDMYSVDVRLATKEHKGHVLGRFKGIQGSVRDIKIDENIENTVFATGLDRFVRAYNTKNFKEKGRCYTKLKQNCLVVTSFLNKE